MASRYEQLRQAIANLAAAAEVQHAYLETIHAPVTRDADATGYGNDELALEFEGIFGASRDMETCRELTADQVRAPRARRIIAILERRGQRKLLEA